MKVYVVTGSKPFAPEIYLGVKASKKAAEKMLREQYPHMKKSADKPGLCSYFAEREGTLLFIHEEEI